MNKQPKQLTQKELKESLIKGFALYGEYVDEIRFETEVDENDELYLAGACVTFKKGSANRIPGIVYNYLQGDLCIMLNRQFCEEGVTACRAPGVFDINFEIDTRTVGSTQIPVFKCTAMVEEYEGSLRMMSEQKETVKNDFANETEKDDETVMKSLADIRRQEMAEYFSQLDDQDLMEMVSVHFRSHPTLPGEKNLKMMANDKLVNDGHLSENERQEMIQRYAQTRIRETKIDNLYETPPDLSVLKTKLISQNGTVSMSKANVDLVKLPSGNVAVEEQRIWKGQGHSAILGKLPDKFLTNNPMNVELCDAELQIMDYSNGKMKNVSMCVVVDTDLMSGDVVNLDENMLAGINQVNGLAQ